MIKHFLLYLLILLCFISCYSSRLKKIDSNAKNDWLLKNEIKSEWLREIISQGRLLSPGKSYSINAITDSVNKGQLLRFELRNNEYWTDITGDHTFRSEIDTKDKPSMGSEKWYRFSISLPEDFPIEDNRLVLAQWHGADKWWLGEHNRTPVLAFRYRNGEFNIRLMHSVKRIIKDVDNVPSEKLFKTKNFPLNEWHDFIIQARWTYKNDGLINIWWNNVQIVNYKGPVGYNDNIGPHFQFGIYRDSTSKTYVSYMKNVIMGNHAEEIDFRDLKTETNNK